MDGTSAVMLSGETSVGDHPVNAVRWMAKIAVAAEQSLETSPARHPEPADRGGGAVMRAAVELGMRTGAAALVVPTSSGASARVCSKYRPAVPIVALADEARVAQQLALEWGVIPTTITCPATVDELISAAIDRAAMIAGLEPGATVVLTAGNLGKRGTTNLIVLRDVPELARH
jgi:pyruvate kinase